MTEENNINYDDDAYSITAKGFFCLQLMKHNISLDDAVEAWGAMHSFTARTAIHSGYTKGFPAIVFDDKGGTCIKIPKDIE
jgi:hypothetical protein